jgi:hypothetical protein
MTSVALRTAWLTAAICVCAGGARTEIIDRIAVSVGNQVITEDQISEEIRVTAFLNREKPDLSAAQKRRAVERLIEQTLIRREIDFSKYPVPPVSDADQALEKIRAQYANDAAFEEALKGCGMTEKDLRNHLWWQLAVLRFIDYRFRPGIQIKDAEVAAYYQQQVEKWQHEGVQPIPTLDDSRTKIEEILTQKGVDQALDRWLGDTRTQVEIRYHSGAFE